MNALLDNPPTSIEIDGREYAIRYDYRTCLTIILAFEDNDLTPQEKTQVMLELLYKEIPDNLQAAAEKAVLFLDCGEERESNQQGSGGIGRLFSFSHDAKYIFSAIQYSHGIDLDKCTDLHWWKFNYLFLDLDDHCFFNRMIYFRRQKALGKLTSEEQKIYVEMAHIFDLPVQLSAEEQAADDEFMELLKGGE